MKLTTFLIVLTCLQTFALTNYAQNKKLDIKVHNMTLSNVLGRIEDQSDYFFFYNNKVLDLDRVVSLDVEDKTITEVLDELFRNTGIKYTINNRQIILASDDSPSVVSGQQQLQTVSGTVTDVGGMPLPGVTVVVKGTTTGTITDFDGVYSLDKVPSDAILQISFVGMKTQEIPVAGKTQISVVLEEETIGLDDVVVTGYSVERKADIVGSVAVVDTEEMQKTNSPTVGAQLQGRAAGVFVQSSGSPDGESKVRIRGFGSFGGSEPLYIVDGVPVSSGAFNSMNPNDVASIQVLKDAASASVYGARAANGVIIVSTKKGKVGKAKVSVSSYTGVNYVSKNNFPDLLNAQEYGDYWWAAYKGAGLTPSHAQYGSGNSPVIPEYIKAGSYSGAALEGLKTSDPALFSSLVDQGSYDLATHQIVKSADTDWFDEVFSPASITNIQLGISGGSEAGTYSVSLNYFDQDDTSNEWASFRRYTARANTIFNIGDHITIGENLQVAYSEKKGDGTGAGDAWRMNPLVPVWDIMGNPAGGSAAGIGNAGNPIAERWRNRFDKRYNFAVFGNIYADINLHKDLVFHTSFGMDYMNTNLWDVEQQTYENAENTSQSSLTRNMDWNSSWTWTNTLTFNKKFGDHAVKLLLGTEAIRAYGDGIEAARVSYDINDDPNFVALDSGIGAQSNSGTFTREMLASQFARFDYTFADKYLLNATVRRDGSSKFGKNNRYGIFPAVALGWRISQEDFMSSIEWLDDLKLRASWGIIGNQNGLSADNQYTQYVKTLWGGYAMTGGNNVVPGYEVSTIGNPDAKWEKSTTTNVGVDATILNGKFDVNFEYYVKETRDLLVQNQAPLTGSNAVQPNVNIGNMTNKGIDLSITNRGEITRKMSYEASVSFSHYKNEVNQVLGNDDSFLAGAYDPSMGIMTRTEKGYPISYIWGYKVDGFFESEQEAADYAAEYSSWITPAIGRWRIKDLNGDKVIDENDRSMIGSPHPDFQVGFNFSLTYGNFDLSTFIFWNQGGEVFNLSRRNTDTNYWSLNRSRRMLTQSWDPTPGADNSNAVLPKLDISDSETLTQPTDYFVEDNTYVRMKTLQLGYTLPNTGLIQRLNISRLRLYVQAQNLFTYLGGKKPFSGLDPDALFNQDPDLTDLSATNSADIGIGVVQSQNPTPKQFVFGINLDF